MIDEENRFSVIYWLYLPLYLSCWFDSAKNWTSLFIHFISSFQKSAWKYHWIFGLIRFLGKQLGDRWWDHTFCTDALLARGRGGACGSFAPLWVNMLCSGLVYCRRWQHTEMDWSHNYIQIVFMIILFISLRAIFYLINFPQAVNSNRLCYICFSSFLRCLLNSKKKKKKSSSSY